MTIAERYARARAAGDPGLLASAIPFCAGFGIDAALEAGRVTTRMAYSDALIGNAALPALHGGAIGALLESAAVLLLVWESEPPVLPKTISMTIDFLRSGRAVDTFAAGRVTRKGRRVASVRVEAWQDDRALPIAVGQGHFLVTAGPDA